MFFLKLHSLSVVPRNTSLFRRSHTYLHTVARFFLGRISFSGALSVRPLRSWGGGHEIPADDRKGLTSHCESTSRRNRPNKLSIFAASSATLSQLFHQPRFLSQSLLPHFLHQRLAEEPNQSASYLATT